MTFGWLLWEILRGNLKFSSEIICKLSFIWSYPKNIRLFGCGLIPMTVSNPDEIGRMFENIAIAHFLVSEDSRGCFVFIQGFSGDSF